jgi:purine nucleosidase
LRLIDEALRFYDEFHLQYDKIEGSHIHDAFSVAVALDAALATIVSAPSAVEMREGITQGDLLVDVRGRTNTPANSRVAIAGDGEAFLQRFAERVGRFSAR